MKYGRVYNFSAGPAIMPLPVLEEIQSEVLNYNNSGMSVMEMSHRSAVFSEILAESKKDLRELMNIPDNYTILYIQGGGTLQFSMIPMNLLKKGEAVYIDTGSWSGKALKEAKKFGKIITGASSADKNYTYIPDCSDLPITPNTDYVYICENETINGIKYNKLPNVKNSILVSDQSSMFLSEPTDVASYGLIYGGIQKNVGPAGMSIVIIRTDLIRDDLNNVPLYLNYKIHADNDSMYNTPNCWAIYCCGKVFKYLKKLGGLEKVKQNNIKKANILYEYLDSSKLFKGTAEKNSRSLMNIPFRTESDELDAKVIKLTKEAGFENLKGHKSVGGLRASIYNAMPIEGVEALVDCLKNIEKNM